MIILNLRIANAYDITDTIDIIDIPNDYCLEVVIPCPGVYFITDGVKFTACGYEKIDSVRFNTHRHSTLKYIYVDSNGKICIPRRKIYNKYNTKQIRLYDQDSMLRTIRIAPPDFDMSVYAGYTYGINVYLDDVESIHKRYEEFKKEYDL